MKFICERVCGSNAFTGRKQNTAAAKSISHICPALNIAFITAFRKDSSRESIKRITRKVDLMPSLSWGRQSC